MRVVVNGLAALKPKTGVGHHVAQLAAHLAAGFPADGLSLYPGARVGRWVARLAHRPAGPAAGGRRGPSLVAAAKGVAKRLSGAYFRAYCRAFGFDLYHEPNFVPFAADLPTVVTVHDLSVVRFPDWHPADRVRFHARHFAAGLGRRPM